MVIFDEDSVIQAEAVVVSSAAADGVFFEDSPAGQGLTSVIDFRFCALDCPDVLSGCCGYAAEPLEEIQRNAFGAEDGAKRPFNCAELASDISGLALLDEDF